MSSPIISVWHVVWHVKFNKETVSICEDYFHATRVLRQKMEEAGVSKITGDRGGISDLMFYNLDNVDRTFDADRAEVGYNGDDDVWYLV